MLLRTYLIHPDFVKAIESLHPTDLLVVRLSAYHIIRILEHSPQRTHYQLSSSDKGTVIENNNGTIVNGGHYLVKQWEAYPRALKVYFNIASLCAQSLGLPLLKRNMFSISGSFSVGALPTWLTPEFCVEERELLLFETKHPKHYLNLPPERGVDKAAISG